MAQTTANTPAAQSPSSTSELLEDVRESATVGQQATAAALRKFRETVDEAVPEAVQPLRSKIVDAAVELAETLVTAQYQFNRNLVRAADKALSKPDDKK